MTGQIILIATLLLPLILGIVFRVATSHLFFSIMAGELLARYFGHDLQKLITKSQFPVGETVIVLTAMMLTAIFLKGTLGKNKLLLHIVPLLFTGIVLAAFLLPLMPEAMQDSMRTSIAGQYLLSYDSFIIGGVVTLQLVLLWLLNRSHHNKHGSSHH